MTYYGHDSGESMPHTRSAAERNKIAEEKHKAAAEKKGCFCVYPAENELQIDIDSFEAFGLFYANRRLLGSLIEKTTDRPSPSNKAGRYHITVYLTRPVKDKFERIALQCLLGSDPTREALSYKAAVEGVDRPTLFFEKAEDGS